MRSVPTLFLGFVCALGAACAGSRPAESTSEQASTSSGGPSASPSASGAITIVPLRLQGHVEGADHVGVLRPDGVLAFDGREVARFQGNQVLSPTGTVLLETTADGHVSAPGHAGVGQLTETGELIGDHGRVVVNADGTVDAIRDNGTPERAPFTFDAVPANARRTAALIVAIMLMPTNVSEAPASVSVTTSSTPASIAPASAAPSAAPSASPPPARRRRGH